MNMGTPCFKVVERGNIEFTAFSKRECNEEEKKTGITLWLNERKANGMRATTVFHVSCLGKVLEICESCLFQQRVFKLVSLY